MLNTIRFGFESKISNERLSWQEYKLEKIVEDEQLIQDTFSGFTDDKRISKVSLGLGDESQDFFEVTIKANIGAEPKTVFIERQEVTEINPRLANLPSMPHIPRPDPRYQAPEPVESLKERVETVLARALDYWTSHK